MDVLLVLALLLAFGGGPGGAKRAPPRVDRACEPMRRTGEASVIEWARRRLALTLAMLRSVEPGVSLEKLDDVALSLLAHWAHETAKGASEFNFNLGGWTAARGAPCFLATDAQSPDKRTIAFESWPDLPTSVTDHVNRLQQRFRSAWDLLTVDPTSDAWVRELGRRGYYTAPQDTYARAWTALRAELGRLVQ